MDDFDVFCIAVIVACVHAWFVAKMYVWCCPCCDESDEEDPYFSEYKQMPSVQTVGISLGPIALTIVITRGLIEYCDQKDDDDAELQTNHSSFTNTLCCTNLNIGGLGEQSNR